MGEDGDAAEHDRHCVKPHHNAGARPNRADGNGGRDRGRGMARRHAGKGGMPGERHIGKRILVTTDKRTGATDQALDNGDEQSRHANCEKYKAEPRA